MPTSTEGGGNKLPLSFEFFPPRNSEGARTLAATQKSLAAFEPELFSVTYGAGGSTFEGTHNTVKKILDAGHRVAPHLSFSSGEAEHERISDLLKNYRSLGVRDLVALRGDAPIAGRGPMQNSAEELVRFIRKHSADHFRIAVAAYPECHPYYAPNLNLGKDLLSLQQKMAAGADLMITQFFFNADAYFYFRDAVHKLGIEQQIRPGIMPLHNPEQLSRFAEHCGAEIPRWLCAQLEYYSDDPKACATFCDTFVTRLCQRLLDGGAPGLHFYTLNRADASTAICQQLGCWGTG